MVLLQWKALLEIKLMQVGKAGCDCGTLTRIFRAQKSCPLELLGQRKPPHDTPDACDTASLRRE
jgi:hypothetical protein